MASCAEEEGGACAFNWSRCFCGAYWRIIVIRNWRIIIPVSMVDAVEFEGEKEGL